MNSIRHQCLIYEGNPSTLLPRLIPLLGKKLKQKHRCLFLASPSTVTLMKNGLTAGGLDVTQEVRHGSLVLSSDQSHLNRGHFEPERLLGEWKKLVNKAIRDGFKGLWVSGDMTWEFGPKHNLSKLLQYECGSEILFRTLPKLSAICLYHRDTLPMDMIGHALQVHQAIYIDPTHQRVNPYYRKPEDLLAHTPRLMPEDIETMVRTLTQKVNPVELN